jgi:exonuclease III
MAILSLVRSSTYKLAWFERLTTHAAQLMTAGVPVVLAGDYNVVPTAQDIYQTRSLDDNALIQPESRRPLRACLLKDGPMLCASCNQTGRSGRSGIISASGGRSTKGCAWITSCSRRN